MHESSKVHPTILVAEDDGKIRGLIKTLLEAGGHRVVEAVDGPQAVEMARRERPELIIMDLSLPLMDGFAAISHIRKHAGMESIPIVILTAHSSAEMRAESLAGGWCSAFIVKPFERRELAEVVERLLSRQVDIPKHMSKTEN